MLMVNEMEIEFQRAAATSDMFQLLALSMQLPKKELAVGLLDGSLAADVTALCSELGVETEATRELEAAFGEIRSAGGGPENLLSALRQEYTRLFCHPKQPAISIYEALFRSALEGQAEARPLLVISPAALDAERCYRKAGLKMSAAVRESGDHMATELEFMMYLYQRKAQAIQEDSGDDLARRNAEIAEFERLHLNRWAKAFFDQCSTISTSPFYRAIGETGSHFLTGLTAGN